MQKRQIIITVLCIFVVSGYLFNQEWPQSLETPLREEPYNFTSIQYNMIFVATMLPIAFLSIPIGMLIDRIPLLTSCWLIIGLQLISQTLMAIMFFFNFKGFYYVVLVMRMLFGLTTESVYSLQSIIIERSISKKNLDFVLSLGWTFPMLFEASSAFIGTAVYDATKKMYLPLFIGAGFCLISLCAALLAISYQKNQKDKLEEQKEEQEQQEQSKFSFSDLKKLEKRFWIYVLVVFLGNVSMTPYIDNLIDLLVKRFGIDYANAGLFVMIPSGLCPLFAFIWLALIKRYPHKRRIIFISMACSTVMLHFLMLITPNSNEPTIAVYILVPIALAMYSISFSGFLGLIAPSTSILVPKNQIGTAYGCVGSMFAFSMCIMPVFNGLITSISDDLQKSYLYLEYVYLPLSLLYLGALVYLRYSKAEIFKKLDMKRGEGEEKERLISSVITDEE